MADGENDISRFIARADADISRAIVRIADSVAHRFRRRIPNAAATDDDPDISPSIVPPLTLTLTKEEIHRLVALAQPVLHKIGIVGACCMGLTWIVNGYLFNVIPMLKLEQPKPIERCLSFSKYSRTPYLKGLKGILETDTGCTQVVEQHLEDTSRAVVSSSKSTG